MNEYDFILKFDLQKKEADPEKFFDALYDAGCHDASVGFGQNGQIALNFTHQSNATFDALSSAIIDVKKAITDATLIEATQIFLSSFASISSRPSHSFLR